MAGPVSEVDNAAPRAIRPPSPIRIDWASLQSSSAESNEESKPTERNVFQTPTTKAAQLANPMDTGPPPANKFEATQSSSKVYDVPTLMKYQTSLAGIAVFAKIKPEALTENLFPYIGAQRHFKPSGRVRALSELSNLSRHGIAPQYPAYTEVASSVDGVPYRDNPALKHNDGFVRFLKQHASPPHHRVTAGGRIVPTGPHSPPPMFDYASLTGIIDRRRQQLQDAARGSLGDGMRDALRGAAWSVAQPATFENRLLTANGYEQRVPAYQAMQNNLANHGNHGILPSFSTSALNRPTSLVPVGNFDDGSMMASCNGSYYRTYWNGVGTVIEPLSITAAQLPVVPRSDLPTPIVPNQPREISTLPSQAMQQPMPLANATNKSRVSSSGSQVSKSAQILDAQQRTLKANLQDLDRHMALHHYELSQEQRASFVSQRRSLIEDIDSIRRLRESSSPDLPCIGVKGLAKRATDRISKTRPGQQRSVLENRSKSMLSMKANVGPSRKTLSPNAPPFVPNSIKLVKTVPLGDAPSGKDTVQLPGMTSRPSEVHDSKQTSDGTAHQQEKSLDRDPIDPAMRVIHNSDIAYAVKYENGKLDGRKRYCTTVSEFQDALRHVRQHARLYGCAGGSSKDPAYDAEQDIWWAICDQDPIPLPTEAPDHVRHPRPWDWNNSYFNYRVGAGDRLDKTPDENAPDNVISRQTAKLDENQKVRIHHDIIDESQRASSKEKAFRQYYKEKGIPYPGDPGSLTYELEQFAETNNGTFDKADFARIEVKLLERREKAKAKLPKSLSESSAMISKSVEDTSAPTLSTVKRQSLKVASGNAKPKKASQQTPKKDKIPMNDSTKRSAEVDIENVASDQGTKGISGRPAMSDTPVMVIADQPKAPQHRSKAKGEKSKGPKRVKSRQQLKSTTPLQRHRHSLKALKSDQKTSNFNTGEPTLNSTQPEVIIKSQADTSTEVNNSSEVEVKPHSEASPEAGRRSLLSRTGQQLSPRAAAKKALQFYDRSRTRSPLKNQHSASQLRPARARVSLPAFANIRLRDKFRSSAFMSSETRSVTVTSPTKDSFLRDMLKSTRYSSTHPKSTKASPTKVKKSSSQYTSDTLDKAPEANKENNMVQDFSGTTMNEDSAEFAPLPVSDHTGLLAGKAPSSLAASSFHASALLPQFDGAGKARTSTIQQQHGLASSHRIAKVNLPQCSTYSDRPPPLGSRSHSVEQASASSNSNQRSWASTSLGLDGSGDEPPTQDASTGTSAKLDKGKQKEFDTRGVTEEHFHQKRVDPNNTEHFQEVDRYFDEIEAQEKEHMAKRLRQNTKTD